MDQALPPEEHFLSAGGGERLAAQRAWPAPRATAHPVAVRAGRVCVSCVCACACVQVECGEPAFSSLWKGRWERTLAGTFLMGKRVTQTCREG